MNGDIDDDPATFSDVHDDDDEAFGLESDLGFDSDCGSWISIQFQFCFCNCSSVSFSFSSIIYSFVVLHH